MKCFMSELFQKEIINLRDGACLGTADDFEFDMTCGKLTAVTVCIKPRGFSIGKKGEKIRIEYEKIQVIGDDTILVDCDLPRRESIPAKESLLSSVFRDG